MVFRKFDIISIGDMSVDNFLKINPKEADVHCSSRQSECKISFNYADKIPVETFTKTAGGNSSNVAVGSSRIGFHSALVATLGVDEEGRYLREILRAEKVSPRFLLYERRSNLTTCLNYKGERTLFVYHEPRDYHLPELPNSTFVYLSSMKKGWEELIKPLTRHVEKTGVKLAYNPGTYQLRAGAKVSRALLIRSEIIFVNKQEACLYLDKSEKTSFKTLLTGLLKLGPKIAVITDGPGGSYAADSSGYYQIGIFDVPVIERTGVGDAYATGFMAAIIHGKDIKEAMRWGSFESASVLQKVGPQAGLLTMHGLKKYEERYQRFIAKPI